MASDKNCIFCKIAQGIVKNEKFVSQSNNFIAILDINQEIKGHTLIIPKRHFVTLLDIPNKFGNELLEFTKEVANDLMDKKVGDGFNIIINNLKVAGQMVMHAHVHLIPRNEGDGLRFLTRV